MRLAYCCLVLVLFSCDNKLGKGELLFEQGKFEEAVDFYSSLINSNSNDLAAVYSRGRALEEWGKTEEAIADYEYILSKDERHLNARLSLAQIYYALGEYGKSVVFSAAAVKMYESSYRAHFLQARAKHQLGYTNAALKEYNATIALKKDFGEAYLYRGALKSAMKITSACDDFKRAMEFNISEAESAVDKYCR